MPLPHVAFSRALWNQYSLCVFLNCIINSCLLNFYKGSCEKYSLQRFNPFTGLLYIIETQKVLDLRINVKASYVIVPQYGNFSPTSNLLLLDLGHLKVYTNKYLIDDMPCMMFFCLKCTLILFIKINLFLCVSVFLHVCRNTTCMYVRIPHACTAQGGQKSVPELRC